MSTYRITEKFPTYVSIEIEADTPEEAKAIWEAGDDWDYDYDTDYDQSEFCSIEEV
jgi:hypothetical protein